MQSKNAVMARFASESKLTINIDADAAKFLMTFSGFERWPELYTAVVDDDELSREEIRHISQTHARLVTFDVWYTMFTACMKVSKTFESEPVKTERALTWERFADLFHREEPMYRKNLIHIASMYLCMYHGRNVPEIPESSIIGTDEEEDEEYGAWLKAALGDYQLMGDTIADIEQFYIDHPDLDIRSLLFLAQCAYEGMRPDV